MPTFRIEKNANYTVMSNFHLRDTNLSLKSKGLLSLMLSLPEEWDYSIQGLCTLSADGEMAVRSGLQELEAARYLKRTAVRDCGKIVDWEYCIFECPETEESHAGFTQVEKPQVEKPLVTNRPQINTNQINTKKTNTKKTSSGLVHVPHDNSAKVQKYVSDKQRLLSQFNFSEAIQFQLADYFAMLANVNSYLPDISIQSQLEKLAELNTADQLNVIKLTITRGWKSLDYAVENIQKQKKPSFDTATDSQNQFKDPNNDTRAEQYKGGELY